MTDGRRLTGRQTFVKRVITLSTARCIFSLLVWTVAKMWRGRGRRRCPHPRCWRSRTSFPWSSCWAPATARRWSGRKWKGRQTGGRLRSREWSKSSQRETTMYGVEMDVKCGQYSYALSLCECVEMCKEQDYVRTLSCEFWKSCLE